MRTCIIIDDELNARQSLQKLLQRYFSRRIEVVALAESVQEGVSLIKEFQPDVVFLDVEMPEENGLQLFSYFQKPTFAVIFTTAYEQYAISAIKYAALDYILKPINQIDLGEAITKLERKDQINKNTSLQIETLLHNMNLDSEVYNKVIFPTSDGYELERVRNILYCKADKNYCEVHTVSAIILVTKPLKYMVNLLPEDTFFRIHKSYYVNQNYIKSLSRNNGDRVILDNGESLPIATGHYKDLVEKLS
ncbi:MAG: DNA-binding response regulator [Bacteroidetes bacterium]|nr:MAG: DNA-binding response regulator [Bacteroidota bacterium]